MVMGMRSLRVESSLLLRKIVKDELKLSGKRGAYFDIITFEISKLKLS